MWFNFNINSFVSNYIWKEARKQNLLDFCQALLRPIKTIHGKIFPVFYNEIQDRARWNSQVLVLEEILNDEYGYAFSTTATNSIYINQLQDDIKNIFFYNEAEFGNARAVFMKNESEGGQGLTLYNGIETEIGFDFDVYVPDTLSNTVNIKRIVNNLKISGTKYRVIKYDI